MRLFSISVICALATLSASAAPPAPGSVSELVTFEQFMGNSVENSSLSAHEGKIIILTYLTPW